jgi:hypothetical protein
MGEGLESWLNLVLAAANPETRVLELDYGRYAEAEALLGWLNAKGTLISERVFCRKFG